MASAINAIVGLSSSVTLFLLPALTPKRKSLSLSFVTRRRFPTVGSRLFWRGTGNRMLEIAHFSSNSNQKSEESGGIELSDEGSFLSEDTDYLFKLVAGSFGGGAMVKYGSILFPDITRPNLVQALLMVSLPVLVASIILLKESYSANKQDHV